MSKSFMNASFRAGFDLALTLKSAVDANLPLDENRVIRHELAKVLRQIGRDVGKSSKRSGKAIRFQKVRVCQEALNTLHQAGEVDNAGYNALYQYLEEQANITCPLSLKWETIPFWRFAD